MSSIDDQKNLETISPGINSSIRSIVRGGSISLIGNIGLMGLSVLFQWYQARVLGAEGLGIYSLGYTILYLVVLVVIFGLDRAIVKFVAHSIAIDDHNQAWGVISIAFKLFAVLAVIATLLLLVLSGPISNLIYHESQLEPVLRIMALSLPFTGAVTLLVAVPTAFRRTEHQAVVEQIVLPLLRIILAIVLVFWIGRNILSFAWANLLAVVIAAGVALRMVWVFKPFQKLRSESPVYSLRSILAFSVPVFFTTLIMRSEVQMGTILLGALSTFDQVGIYRVGARMTVVMSVWLESLNSIFSPMIAELHATNNRSELGKLYKRTARWAISFALPFLVIFWVAGKDIMLIFGNEFGAGKIVLQMLALSQLVNVATGSVGQILVMTGYVRLNLLNAIFIVILTVGLHLVFIPRYGALGAALGDMLALVLINLIRMIEVYWVYRIHPYEVKLLKPILAAAISYVMAIVSRSFFPPLGLFLYVILISFITFVGYGLVLKILGIDETDQQALSLIFVKLGLKRNQ